MQETGTGSASMRGVTDDDAAMPGGQLDDDSLDHHATSYQEEETRQDPSAQSSSRPSPLQLKQNGSSARAKTGKPALFLSHQALPHEALLIIFQFLHEQDVRLIQPCMRVCKAWRSLVLNEPRFWHRLQINLDYPEAALNRTSQYIIRLKNGSTSAQLSSSGYARRNELIGKESSVSTTRTVSGNPSSKSLLDFSILHSNKHNKDFNGDEDAFQSHCRRTLLSIMEEVQAHLSELRSLNMHIIGDDQTHLEMLEDIILPQITFQSSVLSSYLSGSTRISNARHIQIVMPLMHSFPLSKNILAFFQSAEILTIRGNWPLSSDAHLMPDSLEDPSPALDRLLRFMAQGRDVTQLLIKDTKLLQEYYRHQEETKRFNRELADFQTYWRLDDLDWSKLHSPREFFTDDSTYGDLIDVQYCRFSNLTTINLFGCALSDNLVLPASGFPKLRSLSVIRCKWGRGLWDFLAHTPNLECLEVKYLKENDQSQDESKTDPEDRASSSAATMAEDAETSSRILTRQPSSQASASDECPDDDTPPYLGPPSPTDSASSSQSEWNHILENSTITIFGDDEYPIEDFDTEGDEDPNMAMYEVMEARIGYSKSEEVYHYPEEFCYPPDIDSGCSWSVITKPIAQGSWQFEAGFRYSHRVYTHYDDQEYIDEDFYSEFDWTELQKRRADFRKLQDLQEGNSDQWDEGESDVSDVPPPVRQLSKRGRGSQSQTTDMPEHITLPRLQSFSLIGGTFKLIWATTTSGLQEAIKHPAIVMPALKHINLQGDRSLESTRICKPVPAIYAEAVSYDEKQIHETQPSFLSHNDWHTLVQQFEIGQEPVPGEASDDLLLAEMSEDDALYYSKRPHRLLEYRRDWRIRQSLMTKSGRAKPRALLALVTGALISRAAPFAVAALMAACTSVSSLDLSYTNVSPAVFSALLSYSGQLRHLSLAGVRTLQDKDLEALPRMCPLLSSLDISQCAPHLTPRAAVLVVDRMRNSMRRVNKLSRIKMDDPTRIQWAPNQLSSRHYFLSMYAYLDFLNILVDEEVEQWLAALEKGVVFSKKAGKLRQRAA